MSDFREMMIDICKLQSDNAKAQAKHNKFQNALIENPIYPADRHDSDKEELKKESKELRSQSNMHFYPLDWQEQQAKDIEEMEK